MRPQGRDDHSDGDGLDILDGDTARMREASSTCLILRSNGSTRGHPKEPRLTHVIADGQHVPVKDSVSFGGRADDVSEGPQGSPYRK
jgi:hypothetical protein